MKAKDRKRKKEIPREGHATALSNSRSIRGAKAPKALWQGEQLRGGGGCITCADFCEVLQTRIQKLDSNAIVASRKSRPE